MYSFAQRSDTAVLDEPLYASYLKLTGAPRPYTDLVMRSQDPDGNGVVRNQLLAPRAKPVLFAKHMAKHKLGVEGSSIFARSSHVLLVREPYGVIMSFAKVLGPTGASGAAGAVGASAAAGAGHHGHQHQQKQQQQALTLQEMGYAALAEIYSELRALG